VYLIGKGWVVEENRDETLFGPTSSSRGSRSPSTWRPRRHQRRARQGQPAPTRAASPTSAQGPHRAGRRDPAAVGPGPAAAGAPAEVAVEAVGNTGVGGTVRYGSPGPRHQPTWGCPDHTPGTSPCHRLAPGREARRRERGRLRRRDRFEVHGRGQKAAVACRPLHHCRTLPDVPRRSLVERDRHGRIRHVHPLLAEPGLAADRHPGGRGCSPQSILGMHSDRRRSGTGMQCAVRGGITPKAVAAPE